MPFHADLHIHSRFSRATARDLDLPTLARWGARKGIALLGTGDFTHPEWRVELKEQLVPAEPGLFRLRDDLARAAVGELGAAGAGLPRFMLQVEISTIYRKGEKTRKVHHLLYAPNFDAAERIVAALDRIGNLASDGRPILGLDSRDLLEITLEAGEGCYLVPAHIWTPWFSAMGSKSGFDSIDECYGDLAEHVFAVETGLSSDPPMNWRLSHLDRFTLVSNSDAHSAAKLGREATVFDCETDYFAVKRALETGRGLGGTVEFFAEQGKYHADGHRKCGVRLDPEETVRHERRCPECGRPLTVGVLHRVHELADRAGAEPPEGAAPFHSLIPLDEVLSEIAGVGPKTKTVARMYDQVVGRVGSELDILRTIPTEALEAADQPVLAEAVRRMRAGRVIRDAGYDGRYGKVKVFEAREV